MSQENVEVVRRILEEDEDGLFDRDWERILDFWDPRGDYYPVEDFPESRPCHGAEEIARFFNEFQQAWDDYRLRIRAITPVHDDRVLAHVSLTTEGRESGLNLQVELFLCFWLRHGRVFRQEDYFTLPRALRALGLSGVTLETAGLRD